MKRLFVRATRPVPLLTLSAALVLGACGDDVSRPTESEEPQLLRGSWSLKYPHLFHDGQPHESANFIVYSEASSRAAREHVAGIAEEVFAELQVQLDVSRADFDYLPHYEQEKVDILADYNQWNFSGFAYRDGIVMRATDSPRYQSAGYSSASYRRVFKHEVMHVVEFLLIGEGRYSHTNSVWLREGMANVFPADSPREITSEAQIDAWLDRMADVPGQGHPIPILVWSDFPQEILNSNRTIEYYPFFELASRWLIDPEGHGGTIEDLKGLYEDLGAGAAFRNTLRDRFGLDLDTFQEEFWDLMRDYLAAG